jgi:hypothetical protein
MKRFIPVCFNPVQALVVLVVGPASLACSAGIIRHDREAEAYRKLGQMKALACVGKAGMKPLGRPVAFRASAVLVSPRWALTAGHVSWAAPRKRLRFEFAEKQYRATRLVPHPDFPDKLLEPEKKLMVGARGADLALVQLDRPVLDVRPATRYRGAAEVGKTVTIVGYGCIGDGKAGLKLPPTHERRGANNVIDAAGGKLGALLITNRVLLFDFDDPNDPSGNQLGKATPVDLEGTISKGDSGGGWFINDGGTWKLIAITSGVLPPTGDPHDDRNRPELYHGAIGAGMRVSTANDWIDRVIGRP